MDRIFALLTLLVLVYGCRNPTASEDGYPSGNAVKDYFHRHGYAFPFYCDSLKPICKAADSALALGRFNSNRKHIAAMASALIRRQLNTDSLTREGDEAFSMVPVMVYFIDSPVVWYRVIFKEYRNNSGQLQHSSTAWQLTDSNRVMARYHTLEFLVNDDGSLEFKCDQ